MHRFTFLVIALMGLLLFCPASGIAKTVKASGMSFFEPGRELIGKEKALDAAKRAAIEKAVGTEITSTTEVNNFMVVRDQIFSRSSGYLKNLRVLKEEKNDYGVYEIEIEADVEIASLVEDVDRISNLVQLQRNPRVAFSTAKGLPTSSLPATTKAISLLTSKLQNSGFTVIKPEAATIANDPALVVTVAMQAQSTVSNFQGMDLAVNEVSLVTGIHSPEDGRVLASTSEVQTVPGDNRLAAMDKGARKCVTSAWKDLSKRLTSIWEQELYGTREITLVLKGLVDREQAKLFAGALTSDVPGITSADIISTRKGPRVKGPDGKKIRTQNVVFSVGYKGWPDFLANEIAMSYFRDKYFATELEEIKGNTMALSVVH